MKFVSELSFSKLKPSNFSCVQRVEEVWIGACSYLEDWWSQQDDFFNFPSFPGRHRAVLYWNILFWSWYQNHRSGLCFSQRLLPAEWLERDGFCRGPHRVSDLLSPWAWQGLFLQFVFFSLWVGLGWTGVKQYKNPAFLAGVNLKNGSCAEWVTCQTFEPTQKWFWGYFFLDIPVCIWSRHFLTFLWLCRL